MVIVCDKLAKDNECPDPLPLRECEVWMNVKSPLGHAKWVFLSGNERYCVVELMRVARYCVYVSTTACFKFATFCLKSATWHISDFNP